MIGVTQGPVLADHSHLLCRTFLSRPGLSGLHDDLFDVLYRDVESVTLAKAIAVAEAVYHSNKTVEDVLEGWRPACLV